MNSPKYSVDTNTFIHAWLELYPPKNFGGLWRKLEDLIAGGVLLASQEVYRELQVRDDDVAKWARENSQMFVELDDEVQLCVKELLLKHRAIVRMYDAKFSADVFVIALAQTRNLIVVTGETKALSSKKKIPNVCEEEGIEYMNLLGLIQRENWSFD